MFWVVCLRLDLPEDAGRHPTRWLAAAAEPILAAVGTHELAHVNLAVSAAALTAFERHGCHDLVAEMAVLAAKRRVELCATAAHGAVLPLLPLAEADRQLELSDEAGARMFGSLYRPTCLWPPALAQSQRVLAAALKRGYEMVLTDERALSGPAAAGERVDAAQGFPGLFLLPVSRAMSERAAAGEARSRSDLLSPPERLAQPFARFRVVALDLTPRSPPPRALVELLAGRQTFRVQDLLFHFRLDGCSAPLPSSAEASDEELLRGTAFAPWREPGDRRQELRWELLARLARAAAMLDRRGLSALPDVRALRWAIDRAWRGSRWREGSDRDLFALRPTLSRLEPLLPEGIAGGIQELSDSLAAESGAAGREAEDRPPL